MERLGSGRRCGTRAAGGRQRENCGRSATTAPSNSDSPGGSESTRRASKRPPESSHLQKPRSTHLQKPPLAPRHEASARTNPPCSRILVRHRIRGGCHHASSHRTSGRLSCRRDGKKGGKKSGGKKHAGNLLGCDA